MEECKNALLNSTGLILDQDTVLLDPFYSATIEGARTTVENVKRSLENPKNKSDRMVVNNMKALERIYSGSCISEDNLREFWELIVEGVCENEHLKGKQYRNGEVFVSSYDRIVHTPAQHDKIADYIDSLFEFLKISEEDDIIKAIAFHFYFVYIHPYCDGNGRTAFEKNVQTWNWSRNHSGECGRFDGYE